MSLVFIKNSLILHLVLQKMPSREEFSAYEAYLDGSPYTFTVFLIFFIGFICICVFILLVVQAIFVFLKLTPTRKAGRDGVVLLHQMPPNGRVLNVSPACLKLETYLRMCRIPYESDYSFKMSSKGKVPWIEYDGRAVADSNFIVPFLNEEFSVDPDAHLSDVEKAISRTMLVTLEENTYWTLIYHSFVTDLADARVMSPLLGVIPNPLKYLVSRLVSGRMQKYLWAHGIGRHSREEIYGIAERDLRAVSELLGKKKFVMGNKPCLLDAVMFGLVAVFIWNVPRSPQAKLIRSELKNLEKHCYNIKEEYFPDWDQLMLKNKM